MPPQVFRKYSHFVLSEAFFQTKQCYSPKIKHFAPPQNFWAGYATACVLTNGHIEIHGNSLEDQSRRHRGALVGLSPQTKFQAPQIET